MHWNGEVSLITQPRTVPICVSTQKIWLAGGLAVVDELDREVEIRSFDEGDDVLECIAALVSYAKFVALDLGLDALWPFVADDLAEFFSLVGGDTRLERTVDFVLLAGGAWVAVVEGLEADAPLDDLVLQHIEGGACAFFGRGRDLHDHVALPLDGGPGVLEVETLRDLFSGLVEGVIRLLLIHFTHDVETAVGHCSSSSLQPRPYCDARERLRQSAQRMLLAWEPESMSTPRALLLDLDRTLVDLQSFTDYRAALADVQTLVGEWADADVPTTDWDRATVACMGVLHAFLGDPRWLQISNAIAVHERAAIPQSHLMPTVDDVRGSLAAIPTAVITLLPTDVAIGVLGYHDLQIGREIDFVVGRDPQIKPKPEPDGVQEACRLLGVAVSDVVMIGDSTWDAEAALAAGAGFVGVPPDGFAGDVRRQITTEVSMRQALTGVGLR